MAQSGSGRPGPPGEEEFRRIVGRHEDLVIRVAASVLRDPDAALDVAQEVFLALHRVLGRWEPRAALSTWLYRTTVNTALAHGRRERRRRHASLDEIEEVEGPATAETATTPVGDVASAIRGLPERQRAVLTLKIVEGLGFREIGEVLEISASSAKTHFSRGIERLRRRFARLSAGARSARDVPDPGRAEG
jgi:RNA polymerase sigma-70 factor (ECF subfamily)